MCWYSRQTSSRDLIPLTSEPFQQHQTLIIYISLSLSLSALDLHLCSLTRISQLYVEYVRSVCVRVMKWENKCVMMILKIAEFELYLLRKVFWVSLYFFVFFLEGGEGGGPS